LAWLDPQGTWRANYTIQPSFQQYADQFEGIRLWIGFPHVGEFYANTVVVTRRKG
jgi:hypothetical protein